MYLVLLFILYVLFVYLFVYLLWSVVRLNLWKRQIHTSFWLDWVQLPIYHVTGGNLSAVSQDSNRPPLSTLFGSQTDISILQNVDIICVYKCQNVNRCNPFKRCWGLFIDVLAAFLNPIPAECFSQAAARKGGGLCSVEMAFLIGFHDPGGTDSVIVWI